MTHWNKLALLSPCDKYRYTLKRFKNVGPGNRLIFVMLNPSTADAEVDDPTIRRCLGFTESLGFSEMEVVNLYAYRATNPKELLLAEDPMGPLNRLFLNEALLEISEGWGSKMICAWGDNASKEIVSKFLADVKSFGIDIHRLGDLTGKGMPRHPLYLKSDTPLQLWTEWKEYI